MEPNTRSAPGTGKPRINPRKKRLPLSGVNVSPDLQRPAITYGILVGGNEGMKWRDETKDSGFPVSRALLDGNARL